MNLLRSQKNYKPPSFYKAKTVAAALIAEGVFPGPTAINKALGRSKRNMRSINGVEARARVEAMKEAGFCKNYSNERWEPPASWIPKDKETTC